VSSDAAREVRPGRPARTPSRTALRTDDRGVFALELALTVPALFLLLLLVFHAGVLARDAVLVQGAARDGARAAATSRDDGAVRRVVRDAVDGRDATVTVGPRGAPGTPVRVTVRMRSRAGGGRTDVTATATALVEPGGGP
jgi:Flp pilus assembly protein TadG